MGAKSRHAETFAELRYNSLELAKEGVQLGRFKGLGEMDPLGALGDDDGSREARARPGRGRGRGRADPIFSKLMGDQVEPRRLFIEQNAKDVRFLDV